MMLNELRDKTSFPLSLCFHGLCHEEQKCNCIVAIHGATSLF